MCVDVCVYVCMYACIWTDEWVLIIMDVYTFCSLFSMFLCASVRFQLAINSCQVLAGDVTLVPVFTGSAECVWRLQDLGQLPTPLPASRLHDV